MNALRLTLQSLLVCAASAFAVAAGAEPKYAYQTEVSRSADVCKHMLHVLNRRFQELWAAEPLGLDDDPIYSESGKYAFPRASGVRHNARMTFEMRFSKAPSSPEFDAIQWKEGRAVTGAPPGMVIPESSRVLPMLVATFDLDNDGHVDTVLKNGFTKGYSYMANDKTVGLSEEYLMVWRSQHLEFANPQSLWDVGGGARRSRPPIVANGTLIRPFVYKAHAYVAQYDMDIGENGIAMRTPPYRPSKETMSILSLRFTGETSEWTKSPQWTIDTICRFRMKQI